jgi:hypothetical protein
MNLRAAAVRKRNVKDMGNAVNVLHIIKPINVIRNRTVNVRTAESPGEPVKGQVTSN